MSRNNQKEISKSEREKIKAGTTLKNEQQKKKKNEISKIKKQIFKDFEKQLPDFIENKANKLAEMIARRGDKLTVPEVKLLLTTPIAGTGYTNDTINFMFQAYQQMIVALNEKIVYPPTIKSFCGFLGVSTITFENWRVSPDDERREICAVIFDYLIDVQITQSKQRKLDNSSTIFDLKASHGMIESSAPIKVEITNNVDINSIADNINSILGENIIDAEIEEK